MYGRLCKAGGYVGLPPQTPLGDIVPKPLLRFAAVLTVGSMLMGWLMRFFPFEPVSIAECFAFCSETASLLFFWGYVGLPPKPAWGHRPQTPSPLRAVLTMGSMLMGWLMRFFRFEPVSIAECFAFCSETTSLLFFWGYVGLPPKPAWGHCPQNPSSLRGGFNKSKKSQNGREAMMLRARSGYHGQTPMVWTLGGLI